MILSKQIAVYLNLVHCRLKQYVTVIYKKHGIDITPEQFLVIDTLWNEGILSQQQIADSIHKDKNSVTKLIDALEKKQLAIRVPDDSDRRTNLIKLTSLAESMKYEVKQLGIDTIDSITEGIPQEELEMFVKVLDRMSVNMSEKTKDLNIIL